MRPKSKKDQEQLDNDLRVARQNRKAEIQQKQALRRLEWDGEPEDGNDDETLPMLGADDDGETGNDADDDEEEDDHKSKR
jgi:hypothetical protein